MLLSDGDCIVETCCYSQHINRIEEEQNKTKIQQRKTQNSSSFFCCCKCIKSEIFI